MLLLCSTFVSRSQPISKVVFMSGSSVSFARATRLIYARSCYVFWGLCDEFLSLQCFQCGFILWLTSAHMLWTIAGTAASTTE